MFSPLTLQSQWWAIHRLVARFSHAVSSTRSSSFPVPCRPSFQLLVVRGCPHHRNLLLQRFLPLRCMRLWSSQSLSRVSWYLESPFFRQDVHRLVILVLLGFGNLDRIKFVLDSEDPVRCRRGEFRCLAIRSFILVDSVSVADLTIHEIQP